MTPQIDTSATPSLCTVLRLLVLLFPPALLVRLEQETSVLAWAKEEITVPVHLWDEDGTIVGDASFYEGNKKTSLKPPRYVVGKLGVAPNAHSEHITDYEAEYGHGGYFTFDLGNPHEAIFVVEDCVGCPCTPCQKGHDGTHDQGGCCPATMGVGADDELTKLPKICPKHDFSGPVKDNGAKAWLAWNKPKPQNDWFCWPSRPKAYLPRSAYEYIATSGDATPCPTKRLQEEDISCHNQFLETDGEQEEASASICTQCFGQASHSRSYRLAQSSSLVLMSSKVHGNETRTADAPSAIQNEAKAMSLGPNFQFGALVRTQPLIDRVWSNIGLGLGSSFLTQLHIDVFLLHVRVNNSQSHDKIRSHVVFHPHPHRYHTPAAQVVSYEVDDQHRRVHRVKGMRLRGGEKWSVGLRADTEATVMDESKDEHEPFLQQAGMTTEQESAAKRLLLSRSTNGTKDTPDLPSTATSETNNGVLFHMDTGNQGISIADPQVMDHLARTTGGMWKVEHKVHHHHHHHHHCDNGKDKTKALYVPFNASNAPPLEVIFGSDKKEDEEVVVSIPGSMWVLSTSSSLQAEEELYHDHHHDGWSRTIFVTYHKNVLGLPLLCQCDWVFDDSEHLLHVVHDP